MLDKILGSQTAALILLHIFHYGEGYPSAAAKDMGKTLGQVQRQFDRLEQAGVFVSKLLGKTLENLESWLAFFIPPFLWQEERKCLQKEDDPEERVNLSLNDYF
jgi:hypothetical protein